MKEFSITAGRVALSKAGRDKGRAFVILERTEDGHALIADGDLRKIEKPKRKKLMHLVLKPVLFSEIAALYAKGRLKNSDIRTALATLECIDREAINDIPIKDESIKEDTACPRTT